MTSLLLIILPTLSIGSFSVAADTGSEVDDQNAIEGLRHVGGRVRVNVECRVTSVDPGSTQANDNALLHLRELAELRSMNLWKTQITDAGLVNLHDATKLQFLNLEVHRSMNLESTRLTSVFAFARMSIAKPVPVRLLAPLPNILHPHPGVTS